jgi:hypothetical protein
MFSQQTLDDEDAKAFTCISTSPHGRLTGNFTLLASHIDRTTWEDHPMINKHTIRVTTSQCRLVEAYQDANLERLERE